jgi:hypothetical protein
MKVKTVKKLKRKSCKNCEKDFQPIRPFEKCCSIPCAIAFTRKQEEKREQDEWRKEKLARLDDLKPITEHEHDARRVFQKFIRLRDYNLPCISCGAIKAKEWDGSHYFDAYTFSGLIFDERNCHKSCDKCNRFLHGNKTEYRKGLIARYGIDYVEQLEAESDSKRERLYEKEDYKEIKQKFLPKIRQLEKSLKIR